MPLTHSEVEIVVANATHAIDLAHMNAEFNDLNRDPADIAHHLEQSNEIVIVALFNGHAIGFICAQVCTSFCYDHPHAEITELYIRDSFRQKGIGSQLLRVMEQELRKRDVKNVKILTGLNNAVAWHTYENAGYVRKEHEVMFSRTLTSNNL